MSDEYTVDETGGVIDVQGFGFNPYGGKISVDYFPDEGIYPLGCIMLGFSPEDEDMEGSSMDIDEEELGKLARFFTEMYQNYQTFKEMREMGVYSHDEGGL